MRLELKDSTWERAQVLVMRVVMYDVHLQCGDEVLKGDCALLFARKIPCLGKLQEELTCSICLEICVRPCTTPCGKSLALLKNCRGKILVFVFQLE